MLDTEIAAYYALGEEADRLRTGDGRLEWLRTWELLHRYLPAPPAEVLDVGGGPGAYAVPLAAEGYAVRLVDAMPEHVDQARAAAAGAGVALAAEIGDARALAAADGSADAVLLLGPLYHLPERGDRVAALREAARVARPGGVVAAAAISRYAALVDGLRFGWALEHPDLAENSLRTGTHRNPDRLAGRFTTAYLHQPDELAAEFAAAGLTAEVLAVEGPGRLLADPDAWLDSEPARAWLLDVLRRVETEPTLFGISSHLLAVARVPST